MPPATEAEIQAFLPSGMSSHPREGPPFTMLHQCQRSGAGAAFAAGSRALRCGSASRAAQGQRAVLGMQRHGAASGRSRGSSVSIGRRHGHRGGRVPHMKSAGKGRSTGTCIIWLPRGGRITCTAWHNIQRLGAVLRCGIGGTAHM